MISVIIINYCSAVLTAQAVASVLNENEQLEVIVVDNTATERERIQLRALLPANVQLILNGVNEGFARSCNQAYAASRGDWVFLLNPDAYVVHGALSTMRSFLVNNCAVGAVGPRVYWDDRRKFLLPPSLYPSPFRALMDQAGRVIPLLGVADSLAQRWRSIKVWRAREPLPQAALSGGHVMLKREALERCGGLFDSRFFMFFEDSDLMLRLKRASYRLFLEPRAEVVHKHAHRLEKMSAMAESYTRFVDKNYRNSSVQRAVEWMRRVGGQGAPGGCITTGRTSGPLSLTVPKSLQDGWLFEWSPHPSLVPSVGCFGTGPTVCLPEAMLELLDRGTYYARLARPVRLPASKAMFSWKIQ